MRQAPCTGQRNANLVTSQPASLVAAANKRGTGRRANQTLTRRGGGGRFVGPDRLEGAASRSGKRCCCAGDGGSLHPNPVDLFMLGAILC